MVVGRGPVSYCITGGFGMFVNIFVRVDMLAVPLTWNSLSCGVGPRSRESGRERR